ERRLLPRLRALRLEDFETYHRFLLYSPEAGEELLRMLEAVAIREAYFFREWQQPETVCDGVLPRLAGGDRAPRRPARLCGGGCASGAPAARRARSRTRSRSWCTRAAASTGGTSRSWARI